MAASISPELVKKLEQRAEEMGCTPDALLQQWLDESPVSSDPAAIPYKDMLEHARDVVALYDRNLRNVYINTPIETFTGIAAETIQGKATHELNVSETHIHPWEATISEVFESGQDRTIKFDFTVNDAKRFFEARLSSIFSTGDDVLYVMSVTRDITENKLAEEELRESETRLALAQSIAHVGYWEWNMRTGENIWSDEFCRICGLDPKTTTPSPELALSILHPKDRKRSQAAVRASIEAGKPYRIEKRIVRPDGEIRWVLSDGRVTLDEEGNALKLTRTFLDITERKHDQEKALEIALEKMRVNIITGFIRDAAHEFRSPLTLINTQLYLMTRVTQAEKRQQYAENIHAQVTRITRLVQMLTRVVELEADTIKCNTPIDVPSLVSMLCQQLQLSRKPEHAEIQFFNEADPHVQPIQGASEYLIDAFRQVLENALRFTPADGQIRVRVSQDDQQIITTVEDTGMGIPQWAKEHVFQSFWRRDEAHQTPGFGLGLPIARRIIQLHDGEISVESEEGKSTCITIRLPLPPSLPTAQDG